MYMFQSVCLSIYLISSHLFTTRQTDRHQGIHVITLLYYLLLTTAKLILKTKCFRFRDFIRLGFFCLNSNKDLLIWLLKYLLCLLVILIPDKTYFTKCYSKQPRKYFTHTRRTNGPSQMYCSVASLLKLLYLRGYSKVCAHFRY